MNYFESSEGFTVMRQIADSMEQIAKELHELNAKMVDTPVKADPKELKAISDRLMNKYAKAYSSLAGLENNVVFKDEGTEEIEKKKVRFYVNMDVTYGGVLTVSKQDLKDMGMTSWNEFFDENGKPREGVPEDSLKELADKTYYEANLNTNKEYLDEYWEGSNNEYNYNFEQE